MERKRVLHFSDTLLSRTETFVQARLIDDRFRSVAATWRHVPDGLEIPCPFVVLDRHEPRGHNRGLVRLIRGPARNVARRWEILKVLLGARPDVVHAHFGTVGAAVAPYCELLGIPLVVSFYGFDLAIPQENRALQASYRRMFRYASVCTAEGPCLARRLVEIGARPRGVRLLPLALPQWAVHEPPVRGPRNPGSLRLLQVARFVEKKGVDLTLAAVAEARSRGADVHLTLAGGGPLEDDLRRTVGALGIEDAVQFIGYVSHDALPSLLAKSDVLIQPSRTSSSGDTEGGYPTILVEALAQGVPVVGTNHADIPFVVQHGKNGMLSPENDARALAENVHRVAMSPDVASTLAARARSSVIRRHAPGVLLRLRERIYREAIRAAPRGRLRSAALALPLSDPFEMPASSTPGIR
jgi:colanic acid/amylovoran biosynthesis glycosyltransferase